MPVNHTFQTRHAAPRRVDLDYSQSLCTVISPKARVQSSGVPRNFVRGGEEGSTNSVEDRENGDLGAVARQSGVLEAAVISYKKFHFV
jgi:hypothetical protein